MADLPVMLRVSGRRVLVAGGGTVATRRVHSLAESGADVFVVAPEITPEIRKHPVRCEQRPYQKGDAEGAFLVVVATNDPAVNEQVAADARQAGALLNRADLPGADMPGADFGGEEAGDVVFPAHRRVGPITLAVSTGGISARAATEICDDLRGRLDEDWATLLGIAHPFRNEIQRRTLDPAKRLILIRRLADDHARRLLKKDGQEALAEHYRQILREAQEGA